MSFRGSRRLCGDFAMSFRGSRRLCGDFAMSFRGSRRLCGDFVMSFRGSRRLCGDFVMSKLPEGCDGGAEGSIDWGHDHPPSRSRRHHFASRN